MDDKEKVPVLCPEATANVLSRIFFWWLNPLVRQGNKRNLEDNDLYLVAKSDSTKWLGEELEKHWETELRKQRAGKKPSLRIALCKTFGFRYVIWGIVAILMDALRTIQPILLGGLIHFFSPNSVMELWEGYLYAMGVGLCSLVPAACFHVYTLRMARTGMWMRIAISSLVYRKCLRLSSSALGQTSIGQIVNLMSNDAQKLDQSLLSAQYLVFAPVHMVVVGVILWYRIYFAVLAGMAILLLMLPFSAVMGKIFARLRRTIAVHTDERVRLTNEMLNAMRIVKMYCWEKLFRGLINKTRKLETTAVMTAGYAKAMAMAPFFYGSKLIAYFTFLTYILMGYKLTAEVVFVTLSLYTPIRMVVTYYLPIGAQVLSEALVTVDRMQEFLLKDERIARKRVGDGDDVSSEKKITVSGIEASWNQSASNSVLQNVSFEVKAGELLIVIGSVGAGKNRYWGAMATPAPRRPPRMHSCFVEVQAKETRNTLGFTELWEKIFLIPESSLLMAILGELPLTDGSIDVSGKLAYVSQGSWVFGASVRENILFGEPFETEKYGKVVEAAALKRDFELMSDGDQTLVGDRGVSLSGGQKARISLARALYQNADIYLLDDPLSAVDAHVSNHIFNKCINGYLKKKARILITHQLQYLKSADKILILSSDNSVQLGTYSELLQHGVNFATLIKDESDEASKQSPTIANGHSKMDYTAISNNNDMMAIDAKKLSKMRFISKSHANVNSKSLGDLRSRNPLLSQSMDLKEALNNNNKSGMLSSYVSAISLPGGDYVEEYVPQAQEEESRAAGRITGKLYMKLFYTGGGVIGLLLFLFLNLAAQICFILADWWLAYWCSSIEAFERSLQQLPAMQNETFTNLSETTTEIDEIATDYMTTGQPPTQFPDMLNYLHIFTGITATVVVFGMLRALHGFRIVVQASKAFHTKMLDAILRCPISFFDNNPIGRILNRFSKDLGQVDEILPYLMYDFIQCLLLIIGVFLVVGITNPWVFLAVVPLIIVFGLLRRYFVNTIRNVKRLESTTKSPVFSHISSTLLGIHTIHACHAETTFTEQFAKHQDLHTSASFLYIALVRWFALRLELICAVFITLVAFCAIFAAKSLNGSMVGLSLNYAMTMMMLFQWGVRQSSEVESHMTSVERMAEYADLPPEAPLESKVENKPPTNWPQDGSINAQDVSLKYKEDGANILDNINFTILPSEKIGIVGRTGAGKSSLISLLFRLVEPGGKLSIDKLDISALGLHDLRKKISIIPQDPVLLTGSVRKNLDPLSDRTDLEIWHALKQVQLHQLVEDMPAGLEAPIQEGGGNLSMGQRQLLCLARAIIMCNKILIIDEATANVDQGTDALIQNTIRTQFAHCTVLTIAHRLNTIIDSDRIMVLDAGRIIEFDQPHTLLQNANGFFYKMAEQTGPTEFNSLKQAAQMAFETSTKRYPALNGDKLCSVNGV